MRGGVEDSRIAYQVVGDVRDFDELTWIARRLASLPDDELGGRALAREEARLDRLAETPQGRLVLELTQAPSQDGGGRALPVVGPEDVRELWRRSHARDRLRVFVLGDVPIPWVLADLSRVGAPPLDAPGAQPGPVGSATPSLRPAPSLGTPLYAWSAAVFSLGPARDPVALAATEALRAALEQLAVPGAVVRMHQNPEDAGGWIGLTARASRQAGAEAALAAALELATEAGLSPSWQRGVDEARRKVATAVAAPEEWLALADRYFSPESQDGTAWPRGAMNRLESLAKSDLTLAVERLRATLRRPRVDT